MAPCSGALATEATCLRDLCFFCRTSDAADVLSLAGVCRLVAATFRPSGVAALPLPKLSLFTLIPRLPITLYDFALSLSNQHY